MFFPFFFWISSRAYHRGARAWFLKNLGVFFFSDVSSLLLLASCLRAKVVGLYVGIATVGVFAIWYTHASFLGIDISGDGHTLVSMAQLRRWDECHSWEGFKAAPFTAGSEMLEFAADPCEYFTRGKVKAATLSLSVLVAIEMFNSLNALSEDGSLLSMPPWANPWLLVAMLTSFGLHIAVLYIPFLAHLFGIVPLTLHEWCLVLVVSFPVILIDELLKAIGRSLPQASSALGSASSSPAQKKKIKDS